MTDTTELTTRLRALLDRAPTGKVSQYDSAFQICDDSGHVGSFEFAEEAELYVAAHNALPDLLSTIESQAARIAELEREKATLQVNMLHADESRRIQENQRESAEARVKALEEALREIDGCFQAAYAEGLIEARAEVDDRSGKLDRLFDIWDRRIMFIEGVVCTALEAKP